MKKINFKKIRKFLPIIGVVLFIYIIIDVGVTDIVNAFSKIPLYLFILALLPYFLRLLLTSYKWKYISKKQKINFNLKTLIKIDLISSFYANVTPGAIGGYIRIFYLKKESKASLEKCIVNMLIDLTTGYTTGFFIAVIGAIVFIEAVPGLFLILLVYLIFNITTLVVFMKKRTGGKILKFFILPLIPKKYKDKIDKSFESFYEDIPRYRDLFLLFVIEVGIWTVVTLQVFIVAQSFSINIPFHMFFLIHAITSSVIMILPISVGGLGIREGAYVILMSIYDITPHIAVAISLSGYIVKILIPTAAGMIIAFRKESAL